MGLINKHHRAQSHKAPEGISDSIIPNPHLYPWMVTNAKFRLNYSTIIEQMFSDCCMPSTMLEAGGVHMNKPAINGFVLKKRVAYVFKDRWQYQ